MDDGDEEYMGERWRVKFEDGFVTSRNIRVAVDRSVLIDLDNEED